MDKIELSLGQEANTWYNIYKTSHIYTEFHEDIKWII